MIVDRTGTLDEALDRLHHTGPEFEGWLSNHGPMAVDAIVRAEHAEVVHAWLDRYMTRLDELPPAREPIGPDWSAALGDERRIGDWIRYFEQRIDEASWRAELAAWWRGPPGPQQALRGARTRPSRPHAKGGEAVSSDGRQKRSSCASAECGS